MYDTTHFTRAGMAVLVIEDLVSRKWITHHVSVEETHTQVQIAFTHALEAEGLLEAALERAGTGPIDPDADDGLSPILLAVSDHGSQMIARDTRKFMAMLAIAQHFGRPSTPTDQSWIESLNGTIKAEWPHLLAISDPAVLRVELDQIRVQYNTVRFIPVSAMCLPTTSTPAVDRRSDKPATKDSSGPLVAGLPTTASTETIDEPAPPVQASMWFDPQPELRH